MLVHLVDTTKKLFQLIEAPLKELGIAVTLSIDLDEAVNNIRVQAPGVVIINWTKGRLEIEKLCRSIRNNKSRNHVYMVIVSGRKKENEMAAVLEAGANDFIFKPLSRVELALRIQVARHFIGLDESAAKSKRKLLKLAREDMQTGLLNRRALLDEALREMGRAGREQKDFSAIMIAMVNFKRIIAAYGSAIGDQVLFEISRRMKTASRPYDIAGRYGISDFLVFLPDTGITNADKVATRMLTMISGEPFVVSGRKINIAISIGVSELNHEDFFSNNKVDSHLLNDLLLESLILRSETAMEKATKTGRNIVAVEC